MDTRAKALLFGLPAPDSRYNARIGDVGRYDPATHTYAVALADGTVFSAPRANMFLQEDIPRTFATPVEQLPALESLSAIRVGPHGRHVVATAAVAAGTVLSTAIVQVEMTADEIAEVERRLVRFARKNLKRLMGLPETFVQDVVFETDYSDYMVFVRAFVALMRNPTIEALMRVDFFDRDFLEQHWRRCTSQDLVWLQFWIEELDGELSPQDVWRVLAFLSGWAYPQATPQHKHGKLLFGGRLSLFQCHETRWSDIQKVMAGTLSVAEPRHVGTHLGTCMFHDIKGDYMKLLVVTDVAVGEPYTLDYGPCYACDKMDTVVGVQQMQRPDNLHWTLLYITVARNVSDRLAHSLADYLERMVPGLVSPAPKTDLPRCANAACARPMHQPLVCARCRAARYCDKKCQTAAWPTHKRECVPAGAK